MIAEVSPSKRDSTLLAYSTEVNAGEETSLIIASSVRKLILETAPHLEESRATRSTKLPENKKSQLNDF